MRARVPLAILAALALACSMPPLGVAPAREPAPEPSQSGAMAEIDRAEEDALEMQALVDELASAMKAMDSARLGALVAEDAELEVSDDTWEPRWDSSPHRWLRTDRPRAEVHRGRQAFIHGLRLMRYWVEPVEDLAINVTRMHPCDAGSARAGAAVTVTLSGITEHTARGWVLWMGDVETLRTADGLVVSRLSLVEWFMENHRRLMVDVTRPAGVARRDPSLAERGYRGLIAHGAAAADVDNDGLIDVFAAGLASHALYRNRGEGTFEDVAARAHVAVTGAPGGAPLFLDMDDDGDQDLFLTAVGRQSLFENRLIPDGRLEFRDVSATSGVDVESAAFSAAAGDVNGDGRPDIHVACYGAYGDVMPTTWTAASNGLPDLLFLNEGGGRFREAAQELGCADTRWGYANLLVDLDDDADLDLVVANDFGGPNGLYLNEGGRFRDVAAERGFGAPAYAMGLSAGDYDRDGDLDVHVTASSSIAGTRILGEAGRAGLGVSPELRRLVEGNLLFRNDGAARFEDVSAEVGPFPGGWAWGGGFIDLDGDGWLDLYTPNGFLSGTSRLDTDSAFWRDVLAGSRDEKHDLRAFLMRQGGMLMEGASFSGHERDLVMLNRGDGRYLDVSGVSGLDSPSDGRAAVFADLDDDGDADVFLRAMHDEAHLLFRNMAGATQGFVRIALRGTRSGRDAWGATVRVTPTGDLLPDRTTAQAKLGGSGFMSQGDPRLLFNLGGDPSIASIDVAWPSGLRQRFAGVPAGTSLLITEGEPEPHVVVEHPFTLAGPAFGAVASSP